MTFRALALLCCLASPLAAQDSTVAEQPTLPPWRLSYFPYFTVSPNDGFMGIARAIVFRQAEYGDRISLHDAVALDAGYSTRDAWLVRARADLPRLADGWRLAASAEATRQPRFGVVQQPTQRDRQQFWVDLTRRIHGRLSLAVRGGVDHQRVEGNGLLFRYPSTGVDVNECPTCEGEGLFVASQTDGTARAALVLDLRDREYDPRNGALFEAGVFHGSAGTDYDGGYALARGWFSPRMTTTLTARVGLQTVSHTSAFGILQEMPAWEQPIGTFGGPQSFRGLGMGAVAGRGRLLAGAEVRQDILNFGELGAITALAFVDGGRVFVDPSPLIDPIPGEAPPSGDLKLTLKNWSWGGGGGIAIRVLRSAQLVLTAARGAGKTEWYVSSGWSW